MARAKSAVPDGFHTVTPQLTLDDAAKAIDWYKKALGAEEVARATGPDGKIMHAEIRIGDSLIMLNDSRWALATPRRWADPNHEGRLGSLERSLRCTAAPGSRLRN